MRTLVLGVDSGTQSTKVLVVNARDGAVVGQGSRAYGLIPGLPPGAKEQHPRTWRDAASHAIQDALQQAKASAREVAAIGVSGQQHGFVPLDDKGAVIVRDLDMDLLAEVRQTWAFYRDRNPAAYAPLVQP